MIILAQFLISIIPYYHQLVPYKKGTKLRKVGPSKGMFSILSVHSIFLCESSICWFPPLLFVLVSSRFSVFCIGFISQINGFIFSVVILQLQITFVRIPFQQQDTVHIWIRMQILFTEKILSLYAFFNKNPKFRSITRFFIDFIKPHQRR